MANDNAVGPMRAENPLLPGELKRKNTPMVDLMLRSPGLPIDRGVTSLRLSRIAPDIYKDHWLYATDTDRSTTVRVLPIFSHPPPDSDGSQIPQVKEAVRQAIRVSMNYGREMNFDPDRLVQQIIHNLFGT